MPKKPHEFSFCSSIRHYELTMFNILNRHVRQTVLTINVPVVYMGRYEVVLRGDYP
jgi:hypothetical protein